MLNSLKNDDKNAEQTLFHKRSHRDDESLSVTPVAKVARKGASSDGFKSSSSSASSQKRGTSFVKNNGTFATDWPSGGSSDQQVNDDQDDEPPSSSENESNDEDSDDDSEDGATINNNRALKGSTAAANNGANKLANTSKALSSSSQGSNLRNEFKTKEIVWAWNDLDEFWWPAIIFHNLEVSTLLLLLEASWKVFS
jgi:hypothetical protein